MQLSKIQYKRKKKTLKDLDIYVKQVQLIRKEVQKVIFGKDEVINKILMTIIGGGHILIDDIPGVGKTTMANAFAKAMGLKQKRVQFTPDVMPSDITGFSIYNSKTGAYVEKICRFLKIERTKDMTCSAFAQKCIKYDDLFKEAHVEDVMYAVEKVSFGRGNIDKIEVKNTVDAICKIHDDCYKKQGMIGKILFRYIWHLY